MMSEQSSLLTHTCGLCELCNVYALVHLQRCQTELWGFLITVIVVALPSRVEKTPTLSRVRCWDICIWNGSVGVCEKMRYQPALDHEKSAGNHHASPHASIHQVFRGDSATIRHNGLHCIKHGPLTHSSFSHSITSNHYSVPVFRTRALTAKHHAVLSWFWC